jgi:hypothetical protein
MGSTSSVQTGMELYSKIHAFPMCSLYLKLYGSTELLSFFTFFIVCYPREHDVSETGSVSVLR